MRLYPSPSPSIKSLASLCLLPVIFAIHDPPTVLLYYRTVGYYHQSIPVAIDAIQTMSTSTKFNLTASADPTLFTPSTLSSFDIIAFLSNSDQVLDSNGEEAFRQWLTKGGGLIGLHAATACLFNDTAFGVAMGSWFDYHPDIQNATFTKLMSHPTIAMLPDRYTTYEEVYSFRTDPRAVNATVLLTVDPSSYIDNKSGTSPYYQGSPHPIAWYRDTPVDLGNGTKNGEMTGRMWMTSLGHTNETWQNPIHLAHVEAGFKWVIEGLSSSNNTSTSSTSNPASTGMNPTSSNNTPSSPSSGGSSRIRACRLLLLSLSLLWI